MTPYHWERANQGHPKDDSILILPMSILNKRPLLGQTEKPKRVAEKEYKKYNRGGEVIVAPSSARRPW